jgi:dTDP-4-dehydrorhamnose reductase
VTSWYGFAQKIFELAKGDQVDLTPISTESYPTPAPRPAYSVLDGDRLNRVVGVKMPDWQDALVRCIARL